MRGTRETVFTKTFYTTMKKKLLLRQNEKECATYLKSIEGLTEIRAEEWESLRERLASDCQQIRDEARRRLIEGCLPLVVRLAQSFDGYESRGVKRIDLIGTGNVKVVEVANAVADNPSMLCEGYLVKSLRNAMVDAVCEYLGFQRHAGDDDEQEPRLLTVSLDEPLADDTETTLAEVIADDDEADKEVTRASARKALERLFYQLLPGTEADLLCDLYLGDDVLTLKEFACLREIPMRRARHLHDHAILLLRRSDQLDRIHELLCECVDDDGWKRTSDAQCP